MSWRYCECGASLYLKTNQHFTMSCRWLYFLETFMELNLCWVNTGISFRLGQARNQYYAGWTKEPILIWVNQGIHVKLGQPEKTFYIRPTRDPISDWANQGTHFRLSQPGNAFQVGPIREPISIWKNILNGGFEHMATGPSGYSSSTCPQVSPFVKDAIRHISVKQAGR